MNKLFFFSLLISFLASCNERKENKSMRVPSASVEDTSTKTIDHVKSGTTIIADSIFPLQIDEKKYTLRIVVNELRDSLNDYSFSTTVQILEDSFNNILFEKTYNFNTIGQFQNPAPGHYWVDLYNSGGGSGYAGTIFNVRLTPKPTLQPIENFGELSYWISDKTANSLLLFQGNWNMGHGESHFEEHIQAVGYYEIKDDTILYKDLGNSKYKYVFSEGDQKKVFEEFRKNEKAIAAKIDWSKFY